MKRRRPLRRTPGAAAIVAAIALALAGVALAKGVDLSTDRSAHRFITYFGFYGSAAVLVLLTAVLMTFDSPQETEAMRDESVNITTVNQSGGINAGTVNIHHETPPRVELIKHRENEPRGESFVTTYFADLEGRPRMLGIGAIGTPKIETILAVKDRQSGLMEGVERGTFDGGAGAYMTWQNPTPGRYRVEIIASQPVADLRVQAFDSWPD